MRFNMKSNHYFSILFILSIFCFAACGGGSSETESSDYTATTEEPTAPSADYKLSDFSSSPQFPDAKLAIRGYENSSFNFEVTGYELAAQTTDAPQKMCANSGKGQHIHLIVDDKPYAAKYESLFDHEVADGEHYLLAFLSRSYHESMKTQDAHIAVKGKFQGNSMMSSEPVSEPMLFYSRPKGTYVGKANTDKIMLDFYLVNTSLSAEGNKVKVEVNNEKEFIVNNWKPYFIEGLPMGDNKVKLTLIGPDGNPIDAPLNPVERVFSLKEDPAEE